VAVSNGPLLGFAPRAEAYPITRCQLQPGAVLLLYTAGVTEAPGPSDAMFGSERLATALAASSFPTHLGRSPQSLRQAIHDFTGNRQ
jgi:serine phosphatase RsbU (regulator of sigma subunit)